MKFLGTYTSRGQVMNSPTEMTRLTLFDGTFRTAYRIIQFEGSYADRDDANTRPINMMIATEPTNDVTVWNWGDTRQVAWFTFMEDANSISRSIPYSVIDPENLIVEDAYIGAYVYALTAEVPINYMITYEKYEINENRNALAMVNNRSQG